jgi:hypothetical protein
MKILHCSKALTRCSQIRYAAPCWLGAADAFPSIETVRVPHCSAAGLLRGRSKRVLGGQQMPVIGFVSGGSPEAVGTVSAA